MSETLFIGGTENGQSQELLLRVANRHVLIAGATGTGKTVTLQILAQGFAVAAMKTAIRTAASQITRQLVRGVLAGLFR